MADGERRIVVEIFSHEAEERLRREMFQLDEIHQSEVARLENKVDGLHRTIYELIEAVGKLRSKR